MTIKLRVLSLGAGVQSTTLALMAAHGEIGPMPDCAIFADTGWEPREVYEQVEFLSGRNVLPFPVHVASGGNIREDLLRGTNSTGQPFSSIPWYTSGGGMGRRQCTKEYKLVPIRRTLRAVLDMKGIKPSPGIVEQWIGISTDEASRMKPSDAAYVTHRWPLIERRMTRWDCTRWLERHGYPIPPKSSCIGCPYKSDRQWRDMRDAAPAEWADAVAIDRAIRTSGVTTPGVQQFMHRSCVPLDQVDLSTAEDRGQLNMFNNECEGMCGV